MRALHARFKADFGGIMCQFSIRRRYQDVSNKKVKSDKPHAKESYCPPAVTLAAAISFERVLHLRSID